MPPLLTVDEYDQLFGLISGLHDASKSWTDDVIAMQLIDECKDRNYLSDLRWFQSLLQYHLDR